MGGQYLKRENGIEMAVVILLKVPPRNGEEEDAFTSLGNAEPIVPWPAELTTRNLSTLARRHTQLRVLKDGKK